MFNRRCHIAATLCAIALTASACNGGLRPTLVADAPATPQPPLELNLPAAPAGTVPLLPASDGVPLESAVDDALVAWAIDQNVAYLDSCARTSPGPGQLCDNPTERDTVRLLGPSAGEIWYIVTVTEVDSFDFGTGYRVTEVKLAGS